MAEAPFTLGPGDTLSAPLWFAARSLALDNAGGQWVHLPDVGLYVPPWTVGRVIALPGATLLASADTVPPAGQVNTGSGAAALLRYSDQAQPASSGFAVAPSLSPTAGSLVESPGGGIGPPGAASSYNVLVTPTGLVVGQTYRVRQFTLAIVPTGSTIAAAAGTWSITYTGRTDKVAQGALSVAGAGPVVTDADRWLDPPWEFVHVAGGQFTVASANSFTTFAVGALLVSVLFRIVPATF